MAIYEGSRYTFTPIYVNKDGNILFDRRLPFRYNKDKCERYIFKQGDTLDYLAYNYYSNAQLWWVILEANPLYLNEWEIDVGDVILIPQYEDVRSIYEPTTY